MIECAEWSIQSFCWRACSLIVWPLLFGVFRFNNTRKTWPRNVSPQPPELDQVVPIPTIKGATPPCIYVDALWDKAIHQSIPD